MATGPMGSTYSVIGERYRQILARDGVRLHLVSTNGAAENIRLLSRPSGVEAGFVQAGTVAERDTQGLVSLGTLFYQEAWLFCHCPNPVPSPKQWNGWRVSIGPVGSTSRSLALKLFALNGVDTQQLRLFDYPLEQTAQALRAGQLDAALIVTGWDSPVVQSLARAPDIQLLGFPRADAYVALYPALNKLVLPRGVADLAANRPPDDTPLIASKASLAVRTDVHPALQFLLLRAASEVHSRPAMFQRAGEFPAAEEIDIPLSSEARNFYRSGPTFLQRTLPFWLAEFVQRMMILIVPLVGVVYPLWSLAPKLYFWLRRRRLYPMYRELKLIEGELRVATPSMKIALTERLDELERRARGMTMPGLLTESIYRLRANVQALRDLAQADEAGRSAVRDLSSSDPVNKR
ncbi:MAG: ABC transporter substrate-binding protein [Proteobacteria bacterium]|nr:ABC transporter substrate-binding protein [Pseudomonadota bacterium]